ncbi:MAG TPA: nitronate monooxygenase family protein [Coleofasciculaceae cyanobacterium]
MKIGQHIAQHPIVQGAMAVRVSGANLAGAVANAGGVGVISSLGLGLNSPYFEAQGKRGNFFNANRLALIDELQKARAISPDGIIGVNILIATRDYPTLARTAAANGANLILTAAGLPLTLPEYTADYPDVALVPMVCGVDAVQTICQTWQQQYHRLPDALIVENAQAVGGHIGTTCETFNDSIAGLMSKILAYLHQLGANIPLIAAGGIGRRSDVDRMLALGAKGVQVGTRFITTVECDADRRYKEFHLNALPQDRMIVPSPVGKPARALRNAFAEQAVLEKTVHPNATVRTNAGTSKLERRCIANCLETCLYRDTQQTYCILQALARAAGGDVENGLIFSGTHMGQTERIMSVAEVMAELTGSQESGIA